MLRRALADLLPPVVRDRVDKLGFVTPEIAERGWVDAAAARRRLERHRRGELSAGFELWRALGLELWARAFVDTPPSGTM